MTIDGYKSCRKLRKQVLSIESNAKQYTMFPEVLFSDWRYARLTRPIQSTEWSLNGG